MGDLQPSTASDLVIGRRVPPINHFHSNTSLSFETDMQQEPTTPTATQPPPGCESDPQPHSPASLTSELAAAADRRLEAGGPGSQAVKLLESHTGIGFVVGLFVGMVVPFAQSALGDLRKMRRGVDPYPMAGRVPAMAWYVTKLLIGGGLGATVG